MRTSSFSRKSVLTFLFLTLSLLVWAQDGLTYRLLNGYTVRAEANARPDKPTLFVFEQDNTFRAAFQPANDQVRPDLPDFKREMVIGISLPPTTNPSKLTLSRVFVQDSVLTVRYIRQANPNAPALAKTVQPLLLLAIPRQTVQKTRLLENGRLVHTLTKGQTTQE